jgi:hypothetical protein
MTTLGRTYLNGDRSFKIIRHIVKIDGARSKKTSILFDQQIKKCGHRLENELFLKQMNLSLRLDSLSIPHMPATITSAIPSII